MSIQKPDVATILAAHVEGELKSPPSSLIDVYDGEQVERHVEIPEPKDLSAHPYGKRSKPKKRKLKRKGGGRL